ncbi:MAG: DUF2130 domain-containing protein [Myxococcaceae bacterium]|nr:DUF2130 domain-containing protein [Myxococcaceae bacterium]
MLRIREARDKVFNKERDELVARMKAAEEGSASRVRRAADAARKEAEATATKAMAALQKQLQRLQAEATADRQRFQRELATEVRRAQGEARKGAAADLKKRDSEYRTAITKADRSIEHLTRQLDAQRREAEKTVEQRERAAQRLEKERARRQIDGLKNELKVMDERRKREEAEWKRTIEALKLKADGRDRAHFGPEGEEQLVAALKAEFPADLIEHRGKGGDVVHTVVSGGKPVGKIIYECKRTATWQKAFTRQLKDAMALHETRHGLLVSRALPLRSTGFVVTNGVLAVEPHLAASLAGIQRKAIVELAQARLSEDGKAAKTAELYEYLRSNDFGNAIRRVTDKVQELRDSLAKERSHHETWWNTREQHYATVLREVTGIDGRVRDILASTPKVAPATLRRLQA